MGLVFVSYRTYRGIAVRSGGGKQKGAAFERECCRMLSLWVSHGQHEDFYWRSAMSGGRSTVAHAKGKILAAQAGDITCTHPAGAIFTNSFLAECKFYRDLNYPGLLTGTGKLLQFWDETKVQADRYHKLPFMFAKQNRMQTMICLNSDGMSFLGLPIENARITAPQEDLYLIEADKFFTVCKPIILEIAECDRNPLRQ